jgi:hypothetical protein
MLTKKRINELLGEADEALNNCSEAYNTLYENIDIKYKDTILHLIQELNEVHDINTKMLTHLNER